jgi:hypothetical protein
MNTEMNLIQQFPDISVKMHDKFKSRKKSHQWKIVNPEITFDENLIQAKFYNNEFKKWHIKLVFIIALTLVSLYFIVSNIPMLFM